MASLTCYGFEMIRAPSNPKKPKVSKNEPHLLSEAEFEALITEQVRRNKKALIKLAKL
jgi:hypothetical protein